MAILTRVFGDMGLLQPEAPPGSDYLEFARFLIFFNDI